MLNQRIAKNKYVQIIYGICDDSGVLLEKVDLPVGYIQGGDGGLFVEIENALEGCQVGDIVEVTLSSEQSFGPFHPELTFTDDIANVPEPFRRVGAEVEMQNDRGEVKTFRVSEIENGRLTVDGNHPLAGKTLTFNVQVVEVRDARPGDAPGIAATRDSGEIRLS